MAHYGFNVQWLYNLQHEASGPDERVLDAVAAWGFNFIRSPTDYRLWSVDGDPFRADEAVLGRIDRVLEACRARGLHLCLNLHRAPGYIITGGETEPDNLWEDPSAQPAFVATWERFAELADLSSGPGTLTQSVRGYQPFGWGFALWEFAGPFGIVGHRRPGAVFEPRDGFQVDRNLLELMQGATAL